MALSRRGSSRGPSWPGERDVEEEVITGLDQVPHPGEETGLAQIQVADRTPQEAEENGALRMLVQGIAQEGLDGLEVAEDADRNVDVVPQIHNRDIEQAAADLDRDIGDPRFLGLEDPDQIDVVLSIAGP